MEKYQWAYRVTVEYLDDGLKVEETCTEVCESVNERLARANHAEIARMLADPKRKHPKHRRISAVELLRRPIGEWEAVS